VRINTALVVLPGTGIGASLKHAVSTRSILFPVAEIALDPAMKVAQHSLFL